jgi:tetratricopeptide (TPR) repeat protein
MKVTKSGFHVAGKESVSIAAGAASRMEFVLQPDPATGMQLEDRPNFAVAGITDWTAAGGHGSDTNLRTSESLARETRKLVPGEARASAAPSPMSSSEQALRAAVEKSPQSFEANRKLGQFCMRAKDYRQAISPLEAAYRINSADSANAIDLAVAYKSAGELDRAREILKAVLARPDTAAQGHASSEKAGAYRLLGDIDEQSNDSLSAVQDYERATRLDASEREGYLRTAYGFRRVQLDAVLSQLVLEPLLLVDEAGHAQAFHDLRVTRATTDFRFIFPTEVSRHTTSSPRFSPRMVT